jgi:hypothetical protein
MSTFWKERSRTAKVSQVEKGAVDIVVSSDGIVIVFTCLLQRPVRQR